MTLNTSVLPDARDLHDQAVLESIARAIILQNQPGYFRSINVNFQLSAQIIDALAEKGYTYRPTSNSRQEVLDRWAGVYGYIEW